MATASKPPHSGLAPSTGWGSNYAPPSKPKASSPSTSSWWQQYQGWVPEYTTPASKPTTKPTTSGSTPGSTTGSGSTPTTPAVQFNQSAFDLLNQWANNMGLSSLSGQIKSLVMQGITDTDSISLMLQNTPEWKTRFAGNEALKAKGLDVLSVSEYLATEKSYAQIMKNYGLPSGFYDDPADFAKFIGNEVSPNELQQRAGMYADLANREDPAITNQLLSMGLSKGDLMAYMMDPTRAEPLIQKKYQTTLVGAAALRNGVTASDPGHLVDLGVSEQQAIQGFGQISQMKPESDLLGSIYHQNVSESDLEGAVFENNGAATNKINRLASQERAAFGGQSGVAGGSQQRSTGGLF